MEERLFRVFSAYLAEKSETEKSVILNRVFLKELQVLCNDRTSTVVKYFRVFGNFKPYNILKSTSPQVALTYIKTRIVNICLEI